MTIIAGQQSRGMLDLAANVLALHYLNVRLGCCACGVRVCDRLSHASHQITELSTAGYSIT